MQQLRIGKRLVFTLLLLAISVLLSEFGLQLFYRLSNGQWLWQWWEIPIYETDEYRVFRVKRNLKFRHATEEYKARYYTNQQGFRTDKQQRALRFEKGDNTYRIMYLGPSFTFGWGVDYEQSYEYLINKQLHIDHMKIESINVGTPAQPMNYQLSWLRKIGFRYLPNLIVQTVYSDCCMNMAEDGALPQNPPYVRNGYLYAPRPKNKLEYIRHIINRYRRYSALIFYGWLLYSKIAMEDGRMGSGEELYKSRGRKEVCGENTILKKYRNYRKYVWKSVGWEIPIVFIYIPLAYVVRPADIMRVKHHGDYKNPIFERSYTQRVEEFLNKNGIIFIDLTKALVSGDRKNRMYNFYDIHFTIKGNQVAAEKAAPIIEEVIERKSPRRWKNTR